MADLLTPSKLLEIMEGNRRLTVRTLELFPEPELFTYAPPGMRPAADLFKEILGTTLDNVRGFATGEWQFTFRGKEASTKQALLAAYEEVRLETRELWEHVTAERLTAVEDDGWGYAPPMPNIDRITYCLENEIHHRGQCYVYLRQLGTEPPAFYVR